MASKAFTREIELEECCLYDIYSGPRAALIDAGFADASQFPGDPGNNKVQQKYVSDAGSKTVKRLRRDFYSVTIKLDVAKRNARIEAEELRRRREKAEKAEKEIAALPRSPDEFRYQLTTAAVNLSAYILDQAKDGIGGYRVSAERLDAIEDAAVDFANALRAAGVVFDATERRKLESAVLAEVAGEDTAFQRLMIGLVGSSP